MAIPITATVSIEGSKPLADYLSISIKQELFSHHSFRIVVPYEVLETNRTDGFFHQAHKQYCGKFLTINLVPRYQPEVPPLLFKGIITHIGLENSADFNARFVLSGYSLCYLLEDGTQRRTFQNKTLQAIFNQVLGDYHANPVPVKGHPQHKEPLEYAVQYAESNYAFLRRLADTYGEWFYYDGQALRVGPPAEAAPLTYTVAGTETFTMDLELLPAKFKLGRYDYLAHTPHAGDSDGQALAALNPFAAFALQTSERLFTQPARLLANRPIRSAGQLDATIHDWKANQASELVTFQGNGENPGFAVGQTITAEGGLSPHQHNYGRYRLTQVSHWVEDDMYHNTFTALPAAAGHPGANAHVQPPMGVPELAEVIDVADPQHLGRIKVRFQWAVAHALDAESGWLRVSTPYAGDGKGQLFTPEVGSQVLIGYEQSSPDFPVALGNLFHARNKQGAHYTTAGNHIKGLQTAGGNKMVLNDTKDKQTILLSNANKKTTAVTLSFENDGKVHIQSAGPVVVNGSTITLEAGTPGEGETAYTGEILMRAKNITLEAQELIRVKSKAQDVEIVAKEVLAFQGREFNGKATEKMHLDGGTKLTADSADSTYL